MSNTTAVIGGRATDDVIRSLAADQRDRRLFVVPA
jgi:hypothetical protein